jgi:hypothetical protein
MAPATKVAHPQVGKKQSKISTFGRITKTTPAATSQKAHAAKIPPADRVTEPINSHLGAGRKRRYDAINGDESCNSIEKVTTPFLKKVRGNVLGLLLHQLTCPSRESSLHSQTHLRKLLMSTTRLQSLRNHHALHSTLSVFRNASPPNPSQLQTYHRVSRVSSPSMRCF